MPDLPIVLPDTAAAPKDYTLSGSQNLQLKTVRALIDGSGAASAFLPTLQMLDPNGHVMWEGATSETVVAGGSADVSWFPGLGATGANTGAAWFFASRLTNQSIPGLDTRRIPWTHHVTSDPTVFSVTTQTLPDDTVNGLKAGVYIATADVRWVTPQNYPRSSFFSTSFFNVSAGVASPLDGATTDTTVVGDIQHLHDMAIFLTDAVPGNMEVIASNLDGVAHSVATALLAIVYLPNSTLVT